MPESNLPAKLKGLHQATGSDLRYGHQELKMLSPYCDVCAPNVERAAAYWWLECPHDPYMMLKAEDVIKQDFEDQLDDEGNPTGNRILKGSTKTTVVKPWPRYRQVSPSTRISGNRGPDFKRRTAGWILPHELKNDAFPNGIADSCEYRNCFNQEDLHKYASGTYCQEMEAIIVAEDYDGVVVELTNEKIRRRQIDEMRGKLRALG